MNKIIVGQLRINSIRSKFDFLVQQVKGNIDILMISETKLDESFPVGQDIDDVIFKLQNASKTLFQWFYDNQMKANPDKCHFISSSNEKLNIVIEDQTISNSNFEKLLGVLLDSKLTFKPQVDSICQKAGLKLNVISRIIPYMDFSKTRLLVNAFLSSQFNYCSLIWMCHNTMLNNRTNSLHERFLRIIYNDKHTSFEKLLEKDKPVSIYQKNLKVLVTEMFKNIGRPLQKLCKIFFP